MKEFIFILFCVATSLQPALFGVDAKAEEMRNDKTMIITKQDNGKKVNVKCGESIRIELAAMGGAGYNWYPDRLDTEHLELVSEETKPVPGERVGAPVIGEWVFKTKKRGSTKIEMDNYRIWEGPEKATGHFSIDVTIE